MPYLRLLDTGTALIPSHAVLQRLQLDRLPVREACGCAACLVPQQSGRQARGRDFAAVWFTGRLQQRSQQRVVEAPAINAKM